MAAYPRWSLPHEARTLLAIRMAPARLCLWIATEGGDERRERSQVRRPESEYGTRSTQKVGEIVDGFCR
jgi:hypothetical protein